jgi:glycosyltransferase involved in cell wall biosynthesis
MKLLIISAAFPPLRAGESDHVFHLSRYLAERGVEVHVLTTKGNEASSNLPFRVHPIMRNWSWTDLPKLARFLKHCRPDGILLKYSGWIYNDHPMITFAPTISKALLPLSPFVTQFGTLNGSVSSEKSIFVRALRKVAAVIASKKNVDYRLGTLLRDSDRIIVLAELHRQELTERFAAVEKKSILIPPPPIMRVCSESNGVSRRRGREILCFEPNEFVIAYFGYIYPGKGIETLLRAFKLLRRQRGNVRLILIGGRTNSRESSPYSQQMDELCKQLGVEENVFWREYVSDSDEASLFLHAADVCVLPFDNGVILNRSSFAAAAAHGLPIITTKGKVLESPFRDYENLLLCPPKDPESVAAAIELLMDNPELRRRLGQGALRMSREWFSWETAVNRTLEAVGAARIVEQ